MATTKSSRRRRYTAAQRQEYLALYCRSGLSAPVFARNHDLKITTLYQWLHRVKKAEASASDLFGTTRLPDRQQPRLCHARHNLVENAIRPSCVGKRRWLFIGHPQAGWRSAVIYSIIQSCRRRGIDPQEYLTNVLGRLPDMKNTEIDQLLPENWKRSRTPTAA